jgi:DHA2 family multidrug resistance protein
MTVSATAAAAPVAASGDQGLITFAALLTIYMQAVNISLPNAALLHIQGALSMSDDEVGWIFTSYIAANIITLPMTRSLAGRYGRKFVHQAAIVVFALGLVLVTLATTPLQFVFARIVQGLSGGLLAPLSLAILLDVQPPERQARVSLASTVISMLGISSGPAIGGWLSEYHGWQSLFFVSLPLAGFIFLTMAFLLPEKKPAASPPFDFFGMACLLLALIGLQALLDRGERMDWFDSAEIWVDAIAVILGLSLYLGHVAAARTHFLNKALLADRNFVFATVMYFAFGFVLLPTLALTSPMLDELLNYPSDTTGYMTIPRGVGLVGALILMNWAPARIDYRLFIAGGMAVVVFANSLMLGYSPLMDRRLVLTAFLLQGTGLGIVMPALTKAAFGTLDPQLRPEGTMLFNLSRLYGSTIGIAVVLIFFYDNLQAMHLALAKDLIPYRAAAHAVASISVPDLARLNEEVTGQAAVVSIIGQFKILMFAMLVASPLVLFLRKPVDKEA